jgi:lipopolysaccharide transport protein LptA
MDEVEVGDFLDFPRSPDRLSARARRLFWLPLRHRLMYRHRTALPACLVTALVAGGSLVAATPVVQRPATSPETIVVNSVSSNIDYVTNTAEFTGIAISQGDSRLTAERASATAVGFTNSEWTFVGGVVIICGSRGLLRADQATLQFREGELTQVTAIGSPAYIERRRTDSFRSGHGHADQITYDVKQHTIRLYGHAQLADERTEISAPVFIYDVRDDGFQADSQGERWGVHIKTLP